MPALTEDQVQGIIADYTAGVHITKGYAKWSGYVLSRFGPTENRPKLPAYRRKAAVKAMHAADISFDEIAKALGIGYQTAYRDVYGRAARGARTYVYVIGSPEFSPVKIGFGYPGERLAACQTGSPFPLQILWTARGGRDLEWAIHEAFQKFRVRGEWFDFPAGKDPVARIAAEAASVVREFPEWGSWDL